MGAKRRGEAALRNSGLGYTIVRPGPLVEEAGGYKALVFDQAGADGAAAGEDRRRWPAGAGERSDCGPCTGRMFTGLGCWGLLL